MPNELFIHSRCCEAHWELVVVGNKYELQCEKCGKPIGNSIKIKGPNMSKCGCEICNRKRIANSN